MSEDISIIEQDWDELAIDDGSFVVELEKYTARIHPRESATTDEVIESNVDSISYRPEVNSAPSITVGVEPRSSLESDEYISGNLDVFVGEEPLFSGNIVRIETNQNKEFYSIKAESPGRKLKDESIDQTPQNEILMDYLGEVIDGYNGVFQSHQDLADTNLENTSNIIHLTDEIRKADTGGGTITYGPFSENPEEIDAFYIKAETSSEVTVHFIVDGNVEYEELVGPFDQGTYGQWKKIQNISVPTGQLEIELTIPEEDYIYDWDAIPNENLSRKIEPVNTDILEEGVVLWDVNTQSEFEEFFSNKINDDDPLKIENGSIQLLQSGWVVEGEQANGNYQLEGEDIDYSDGLAGGFAGNTDDMSFTFENEYTIPELEIGFRRDTRNASNHHPFTLYFDGEAVISASAGALIEDLSWFTQNVNDVSPGQHTVELVMDGTEDDWYVDVLAAFDTRFNHNLDNSVHQDSGYLDGPELYPDAVEMKSDIISASSNITNGYVNVDFDIPDGDQTLQLSFSEDGSQYFPDDGSEQNTESISVSSKYPSATIKSRTILRRNEPNGPQSATPRYGYAGNAVNTYNIEIDLDELELVFGETFSGNRLSVLSSVADESRVFYRWEGEQCLIFQKGTRKTNVDILKEEVESYIDIEDVFSSCEVIGQGGISSGIIEAENSPSFINRHKEIRDPDIDLESDAARKARSFLADNSTVEYSGQIQTLPTRAPLGEMIDGSNFSHGKDSYIEKVSYSKRKSSIQCGRQKKLKRQILELERDTSSNDARETRQN